MSISTLNGSQTLRYGQNGNIEARNPKKIFKKNCVSVVCNVVTSLRTFQETLIVLVYFIDISDALQNLLWGYFVLYCVREYQLWEEGFQAIIRDWINQDLFL